jgi:8-oxo-dGTP diphosphatase
VTPPTPENRILIAVAALVRPGKAVPGGSGPEVLIALRHPKAIRGGVWELPGGKASAGESAREAAARELLEETGVEVDPAHGRELGTVEQDDHTLPAERSLRLTLVAFEAPPDAGPLPLAAVECRWERITALAGYEWPAANRKLNAILAAAFR